MSSFGGPNIITDGLVLNLDAGNTKSYPGTGTTWTDRSGFGNNGTLFNDPTFNSANGGSIVFDGTNDYVGVTSQSYNLFSNLSSFAVSFWLRETSFAGSGSVLISSAGSSNLFIQIATSAAYIGILGSSNNYLTLSINLNSLILNKISNIVWVKDGLTAYFYLDNNKYTFPGTANFNFIGSSTQFDIGRYTSSGFEFTGNMYNAQIYNRALSASEVLQNYNATKGRFGIV